MTPALVLLLGFGTRAAVGTSLIFSSLVKMLAAVVYWRDHHVDGGTLGYLLMGGLPGAIVGAVALERLRSPLWDRWTLVIVGGIMGLSPGGSLVRSFLGYLPSSNRPRLLAIFGALIGTQVGFSSVGAGALGSVLLLSCTTLKSITVVGTDLVFGMVLAVVGGGIHITGGNCAWTTVLRLVPGGFVGTFAGARLARRLPNRLLRTVVLIWAAILGALMARQGLTRR